jgi:hypothetical protein
VPFDSTMSAPLVPAAVSASTRAVTSSDDARYRFSLTSGYAAFQADCSGFVIVELSEV